MPPKSKRKRNANLSADEPIQPTQSAEGTQKRKRAIPQKHRDNPQLATMHTPAVSIDYDRLADAIIRKQNQSIVTSNPQTVTSSPDVTNSQAAPIHVAQCVPPVHNNVNSQAPTILQIPQANSTPQNVPLSQGDLSQVNATPQPLSSDTSVPTLLNTLFGAIYIQKKPMEAPHLLKYLYMVGKMASATRTDSWRHYDEEFRKLRQSSPLPWQDPLTELVLRSNLQAAATPTRFRQANQPFHANQPFQARSHSSQGAPAKGPKFCYAFNQGQQCKYNPCQFKHACQYCKEDHPRFKCPKLTGTPAESKQATPKSAITRGFPASSMVQPSANSSSSSSFAHLNPTAIALLKASLSNSSRTAYRHSWDSLMNFCESRNYLFQLPVPETTLCNFIAYLFEQNYSPSSILSKMSGLSYVHKILNIVDNSQSFLVRKIIHGALKSNKPADSRLPITLPLLSRIISALNYTVSVNHNRILLHALFTLAFHGFFRLGELIAKTHAFHDKVVQVKDVSFPDNSTVQIIIRYSKTMHNSHPITLFLSKSNSQETCPVTALRTFLSTHTHSVGPLFQFTSGVPVSHHYASLNLNKATQFIGLNPSFYKGHSFRIGAATEAAKRGLSQTEIQKMGRWNSDAFLKYIRINSFHS